MTSLMLTMEFQTDWFKILLLGEAETTIRLVIKFWFRDVALVKVSPFWPVVFVVVFVVVVVNSYQGP